jgi:serine/threonine-protein kinase RsbT
MTESSEHPGACIPIRDQWDVTLARQHARRFALEQGLPRGAAEAVVTAVSELATNIVVHARQGEMLLSSVNDAERSGMLVIARDDGPGIADVGLALQDGYSTGEGLGLGLSSARRLTDEFEVVSAVGSGTTVVLRKWAP